MADLLRMPDRASCPPEGTAKPVLRTAGVTVTSRRGPILAEVDLEIPLGGVFAVIGPSGAGKSTLLKIFNRMLELETPPLAMSGKVFFHGRSIHHRQVDPDELRSRIGMLSQQPVVFPASIARNVLFGVRHVERLSRRSLSARLEEALIDAALWEEVKDRLEAPAVELSVGQQQRLCLARTLALRPEVILMDEPTSALDPQATEAIEQLVAQLALRHTIVLVTHDLAQAQRLGDTVACVCRRDGAGRVIETACCDDLFGNPQCRETIDYLAVGGRTDD